MKVIEFEQSGEGTEVTDKELLAGLINSLMWEKEKFVHPMLNSMKEGLKRKVENRIALNAGEIIGHISYQLE
jgi:hypothetical protein